ncbi:hypothetical protein GYMLUDRAFT_59337 [Collybiopsis luxurians FD-317 M1]|uniref:Uncharacterized protein n=1 Tax=Collybiopsis luxurians FD-317 M1 TaxID=944289 RepID=A0A0D0BYS7_9AGAR|nr:hypothetical protein GYMLUDRAFT_59337 [Collybiopsis luxurians FD-317 M1]
MLFRWSTRSVWDLLPPFPGKWILLTTVQYQKGRRRSFDAEDLSVSFSYLLLVVVAPVKFLIYVDDSITHTHAQKANTQYLFLTIILGNAHSAAELSDEIITRFETSISQADTAIFFAGDELEMLWSSKLILVFGLLHRIPIPLGGNLKEGRSRRKRNFSNDTRRSVPNADLRLRSRMIPDFEEIVSPTRYYGRNEEIIANYLDGHSSIMKCEND